MNRLLLSILFFCQLISFSNAQFPDTTESPISDTLATQDTTTSPNQDIQVQTIDSFSMRPTVDTGWKIDPSLLFSSAAFSREVLKRHPYFGFNGAPVFLPISDVRVVHGKEGLFYAMILLLVVFGLLRAAFPKYFSDLFRLFFRTTMKQRQIREQLMQTPLPSLLLNGFFVVSGALYTTFLLRHFQLDPVNNFWLLFLYCCIGLSIAYLVKFVGLKLCGWLFSMRDAADSYIFIVFIANKMIGIFLLPFLVLLAFSTGNIYIVALSLSWCLIGALIIYRFVLTYAAVRNQVKVNPFHFLLYVVAFEIAPLLLVYKGLLFYFGQTA